MEATVSTKPSAPIEETELQRARRVLAEKAKAEADAEAADAAVAKAERVLAEAEAAKALRAERRQIARLGIHDVHSEPFTKGPGVRAEHIAQRGETVVIVGRINGDRRPLSVVGQLLRANHEDLEAVPGHVPIQIFQRAGTPDITKNLYAGHGLDPTELGMTHTTELHPGYLLRQWFDGEIDIDYTTQFAPLIETPHSGKATMATVAMFPSRLAPWDRLAMPREYRDGSMWEADKYRQPSVYVITSDDNVKLDDTDHPILRIVDADPNTELGELDLAALHHEENEAAETTADRYEAARAQAEDRPTKPTFGLDRIEGGKVVRRYIFEMTGIEWLISLRSD